MEEKERYWEKWNEEGIIQELESVWETDMWIVDVVKRRMPEVEGKVLDVGCGTGRFSRLFEDNQYLGVDTEPKMIERAKELYPNKAFQIGDAYNLEFSDDKYDLVLCNAVLHHIPEIEPAIKELWRVTKNYLATSFIIGKKDECVPQWRGFLSHMITFLSAMKIIHNLNPCPYRIESEYIDLWAHGTLVFLQKQPTPDYPSDTLGVQW